MTACEPGASPRALALLRLSLWPGVTPGMVRNAAATLAPEGADEADARGREVWSRAFPGGAPGDALALVSRRYDAAVRESVRLGLTILAPCDARYPQLLVAIDDAPPLLYVRGYVPACVAPSVAIVGTRRASEDGARAAEVAARWFARRGVAVVSGLALGIDGAAHRGAMFGRGRTIAVLAHGIGTVYPREHRDLAASIVDRGGALVSEHAPGVGPDRAAFVRRNRIQSGLSRASLLVESGVDGGAMHEARFAVAQGRPVYAVVRREGSEGSEGINDAGARELVRRGQAVQVHGTLDLDAVLAVVKG